MVIFTEIPKEVVFDHLFPYLHLNDLLRLRRVCQWTKPLAEDYLALHVTTSRWIRLWLKPKYDDSFWNFLELSLIVPVSRICIENKDDKDPKIWDVDVIPRFVKLYGERITHFQLNRLELPLSTEAIEFFESLTNLKHLTIGNVSISSVGTGNVDLPSTFRKLKELVIEYYRCETGQVQLYRSFLEGCSSCLEFAKHGLRLNGISEELFQTLLDIMINRRNPALKVEYDLVDTSGKRDDVLMIRRFYRLVTACDQNQGKLRNVDAELIEGMMGPRVFEEPERKLSNVIVSMLFLRRSCFRLELHNLEEIRTPVLGGTSYCTMPEDDYDRMEWPNLKKLYIYVDGALMRQWNNEGDPVSRLLSHFFVGARHEKMESLELDVETFERISFPRARNLWESCPNLKRLSFNAWPRTNADLSKLWNHLPCLEDLTFENCPELGNVAFVGGNVEQPTFFNLKKLRNLQLIDVNRMPKITDTLFTLVLRHMPLKELIMGLGHEFDADYDLDIKSFTVAGIKSLLTGVFAETIEKFPLHHLGIKGVSEEEMMALEKEFRSARML